MGRSADPTNGFSLIEAIIALLFSSMIAILVLDLLGAELRQSRHVSARSDENSRILRGRRAFGDAASQASGAADEQTLGSLRISSNRLTFEDAGKRRTLFSWQGGIGRFSYSQDGRIWRPKTGAADEGIIRFTWRDGQNEQIWSTP